VVWCEVVWCGRWCGAVCGVVCAGGVAVVCVQGVGGGGLLPEHMLMPLLITPLRPLGCAMPGAIFTIGLLCCYAMSATRCYFHYCHRLLLLMSSCPLFSSGREGKGRARA